MPSITVIYEYSIGDKVKVVELNCIGKITSLWTCTQGNEYEVRYFYNGKAESVYFYANELSKVK